MGKKIFKYWLVNFLMSLVLFLAYRIVISQTETKDGSWFDTFLQFLDIFINLGFSLIYLGAMIICSFFIFLNLYQNIRNNFYYSLFSFVGLASVFTGYWLIDVMTDDLGFNQNPLRTFIIFCLIYVCFCCIQFLIFRKQTKAIQ